MHDPAQETRWKTLHDRVLSCMIAVFSVVRGLSLLLAGRPRTPLRALCIAAFDMLHVLRNKNRLSMDKFKSLAALLDYGACVNTDFDHKLNCHYERRFTLQVLEKAGIGLLLAEYLRRLSNLEGERPLSGGDHSQFQNVMLYREAVVRLSLGIMATVAGINSSLDEAIEATSGNGDLNLLFRIAMLCQIIDDVLDYSQDRLAGLPSFLTACQSLPLARDLTQQAVRDYADDAHTVRVAKVFPLRVALFHVSLCTKLIILLLHKKARRSFVQLWRA